MDRKGKSMAIFNKISSMKSAQRKILYLVIVCNIFAGLFWLFPRVQLLSSPVSDESLLTPWDIPISYLCIILYVISIITLAGIAFNVRMAKSGFVFLLLVMVVMVLIDSYAGIRYTLNTYSVESLLTLSGRFWGVTEGGRWLIWFIFNLWSLLLRGSGKRRGRFEKLTRAEH